MKKGNKSGKIAPEQSNENPSKTEGYPVEPDVVLTKEEYNQNLKERVKERYSSSNFKVIKFEELLNIAPDFALWLKSTTRYGNVDSQVLIFWNLDKSEKFKCLFYTNDNEYSITGYHGTEEDPKGYLGCVASTRKSRVGEDWHRGSDLHDGEYSEETFNGIIKDIVSFELKTLQLWR